MNTKRTQDLDQIFLALADETRREMVNRLAGGEHTVSELTKGFPMSLAAASKHIKILERAKVVKRRVEGRTHFISLSAEPLAQALDWISVYRQFWQSRLDKLADVIEQKEGE